MANETAEVTTDISGMFDQAFRAFGDSLKVATKAQEDTVKFWSEAVGKVSPVQPMTGALIPTAQRNAEEYLKLLETSYRRNADLVKKVMHNQNSGDMINLGNRTNEWLEAYIAAARDSAQDLASTNLRVAQSWSDIIKKTAQQGAQAVQQSTQQATQQKAPAK